MGKFIFFVVAAVACFIAVESLNCNKCSVSVFGFCINKSNLTCGTNITSCFTGTATFPSLTSFSGFSNQGCLDSGTTCGISNNNTLLGVTYTTTITCCPTNNCNTVTTSDASSTKMTFTAAAGVALLASVLGSIL